MLFLLLSAAADLPTAVDVAGMEPQIVLRLTFPQGASEATIRTYFDAEHHIGSTSRFYSQGDLPPAGCDREPPTVSASVPRRVLGFGPPEAVTRLASIARACGFTRAGVRARRRDDFPSGVARPHDTWLTLDAGEDFTSRYGPTICFIQMRSRALPSLLQEAH
jgi:hypothetical protein